MMRRSSPENVVFTYPKTRNGSTKQPSAKRLKRVSSPSSTENFTYSAFSSSSSCKDGEEDPKDVASLTSEQKSRMEFNRSLAKAKRNLKLCSDKISKLKANGLLKNAPSTFVVRGWICEVTGTVDRGDMVGSTARGISIHIMDQSGNGPLFSVPKGVSPSSLMNIYKELKQDNIIRLGCSVPLHGNLEQWAVQGVLLLNAVLTVSIIRQILMQIKAGSNLQMLSSKQFLRRKKELFSFCGETMPKQKPANLYLGSLVVGVGVCRSPVVVGVVVCSEMEEQNAVGYGVTVANIHAPAIYSCLRRCHLLNMRFLDLPLGSDSSRYGSHCLAGPLRILLADIFTYIAAMAGNPACQSTFWQWVLREPAAL
ncbi:hypothetical protein HAX54_032517 [Datura stramonium]|uniref:Uncharacterized protein n=1 Tax=Datura stramonium TaxID=4076 RepID=A0ABS8VC45_DATST|nr:hypothetical protein [Datura stramonium]